MYLKCYDRNMQVQHLPKFNDSSTRRNSGNYNWQGNSGDVITGTVNSNAFCETSSDFCSVMHVAGHRNKMTEKAKIFCLSLVTNAI